MSVTIYDNINRQLSLYAPCVLLFFGNIGCILNFITFTAKQLRQNSCGWYFLLSAIVDFAIVNFGLITKLFSDYFGSKYHNTSRTYCKLRIYIIWLLPCISTCYLVFAALDRCLSTSEKTNYRSFSRLYIARRLSLIPIVVYALTSIHLLIYYDLRPNCAPEPGVYSIFLSSYSIFWTSVIPQGLLLIFGIQTYRNVRSSRKRLAQGNQSTTNRTDTHLIRMTLIQVIFSSILLNIRTTYFSYYAITIDMGKTERQIAFEALLLQLSSFIFLANFAKSFYLNTLMSRLFRQILIQRLRFCLNPIRRIHPTGNNQR